MEYELIDISFELNYESDGEQTPLMACDEGAPEAEEIKTIERDADGIPMGTSLEDIHEREKIITDFYKQWRETLEDGKVFNEALQDFIYVRNISFIEAKEHSAKSYRSTRAVKMLDKIMKNASPIKRVPTKAEDKNQQDFEYFLIMLYRDDEIGSVKLTIGIRKRSGKNIQYGVSVLNPGQPLVDYSVFKRRKKKRSS